MASGEAMQSSYTQGKSAMSCQRQWVFVYLTIRVAFQGEVWLHSGLKAEKETGMERCSGQRSQHVQRL